MGFKLLIVFTVVIYNYTLLKLNYIFDFSIAICKMLFHNALMLYGF